MADADEDVIPRLGPSAEETDLSDEAQDFRFLTAISEDAKIPKRGEKDFEPHATALQSNTLAVSRQAMHNALSFQRIHQPKSYTMATYHPETNMAYAYDPKGPLFARMGQVLSVQEDPLGDERRGQRMWLLPEEVLYLIERGTVDVRWPPINDDEEGKGLAMSLQGAYAVFIGDDASHNGALTFERYSVYSNLKRSGYTVLRAPSWSDAGPPPASECYPPLPRQPWQAGLFDIGRRWKAAFISKAEPSATAQATGPMVEPGLYRSYVEIYHRLALVDWYDPAFTGPGSQTEPSGSDLALRVTYNVWKPGSNYKKSNPGPPDFRIAVVNGRETTLPALQQLGALMQTVPYDPPKEDAQLYQKIKHGYKNVILAIVDQGVVSYLRIADAAFGREKLYDRKSKLVGGKRGRGRGGRGRG